MIVERPIVFGRSRSLVGVTCMPAPERELKDAPVVVFLNAGIIHRVGPNRLYVTLARALAESGVRSLRFDLAGIGDSAAAADGGSILDIVARDIIDAIDAATRDRPGGRVVLLGLCSGADNAFQAAVRDPRVAGAVLFDPNVHKPRGYYVHHYARAMFSWRRWVAVLSGRTRASRRARRTGAAAGPTPFLAPTELPPLESMRASMHAVVRRGARLLYVFTGGLPQRYNHRAQFWKLFPEYRRGTAVQLAYFGDSDHTFTDGGAQRRMMETVVGWVVETTKSGGFTPAGSASSPATAEGSAA